jgi:site-specific DNA recombinase
VISPLLKKAALTGLWEHLTQRDAIGAYVKEYNAERRRLAKANDSERVRLERRRGEVDRDLERAARRHPPGQRAGTDALEAEQNEIKRELAAMTDESKVIVLHPATVDRYLAEVERLSDVMAENADGRSDELIAIVRRLMSTVTVHANPGRGSVTIEFKDH